MALKELNLRFCRNLTALSESLGGCVALQKLDLGNCHKLAALPESLGDCVALQELDLRGCEKLRRQRLPASVRALEANGLLIHFSPQRVRRSCCVVA